MLPDGSPDCSLEAAVRRISETALHEVVGCNASRPQPIDAYLRELRPT